MERKLLKLSTLSAHHQEIVKLVSQGLSDKEIADRLHISEQTAKNRLQAVYRAAGLRKYMGGRIELIRQFYELVEKEA